MQIKEKELGVIEDTKNNSSKKQNKKEDIITMMEREWPVMTAEFRRLQYFGWNYATNTRGNKVITHRPLV